MTDVLTGALALAPGTVGAQQIRAVLARFGLLMLLPLLPAVTSMDDLIPKACRACFLSSKKVEGHRPQTPSMHWETESDSKSFRSSLIANRCRQ